jgi:hypothetical protein
MEPLETGIAAMDGIEAALDAFLVAIAQVDYDEIPGNADDPVTDRSWMWQYCSEYGEYNVINNFIKKAPISLFIRLRKGSTNAAIPIMRFQSKLRSNRWNCSNNNAMKLIQMACHRRLK